MPADAALLAGVPFFQYLDAEEREVLARQLDVVRVTAGEVVFHANDPGGTLFVIREGSVEVFFKNDTGERIVLETPGPGEVFGEVSFLDGGARTASVLVVEDLEALAVDREDLSHLFRAHPEAGLDIIAAMGKRLRHTVELLRSTTARNVNVEAEDRRSTVARAADWVAEFSGSIPFNVDWLPGWKPPMFDPFPFGFLTLVVSLEAIILSVLVLLSQNRQTAKDRIRGDIEYDVNLKAELEIAQLHEKLDRLHVESLSRLEELQRALGRGRNGGSDNGERIGGGRGAARESITFFSMKQPPLPQQVLLSDPHLVAHHLVA
jgi:CRP/FNR family cyclic AMP-dependent transcriptional regulator